MDPELQRISAIATGVGAMTGSWMQNAEPQLSFAVLVISGVTGVMVLMGAVLAMMNHCLNVAHNLHQRNKDLRQERDQLKADKLAAEKAAEDAVCEERRRTGVCPHSTFRPEIP